MAAEDKAPSPTKTPDIRISDEAKLEEWLRKVPLVWAQAISARAALRVLPVECDVFEFKNDLPSGTLIRCLANFRASFISWAARKYPAHDMSTVAAEAAKAAEAAEAPTYQPSFAGTAVRVAAHRADGAEAAAEAVAGTVGAATLMAAQIAELMHADVTIWNAITTDANWLMGNGKGAHPSVQAQELMEQPLWLEDVRGDPKFKANFPLWARKPFDAFANSALVKNGLWKH